MSRIYLLLLFISCSIHATAQTDYYYYKGNRIPLTINENKVCISVPKDCDETCGRIRANVQVLAKIKDETFDIFVITQSDYEKLTSQDSWEEDSKSVMLTSCYFTENNEEVYATPYLNVKLKKEEDRDLLNSYAEQYKLTIVDFSSLMPLWYVLSITPDSEKSSVQCANELYESGDFAHSEPDFASNTIIMNVRNILPTESTEEYPETYDLQGRRLKGKPAKGLYIKNCRKIIAR
jgi:hypothetical protein